MATRSQFKVTTRTQWKYEKHVLGKNKKKKGCQICAKESAFTCTLLWWHCRYSNYINRAAFEGASDTVRKMNLISRRDSGVKRPFFFFRLVCTTRPKTNDLIILIPAHWHEKRPLGYHIQNFGEKNGKSHWVAWNDLPNDQNNSSELHNVEK